MVEIFDNGKITNKSFEKIKKKLYNKLTSMLYEINELSRYSINLVGDEEEAYAKYKDSLLKPSYNFFRKSIKYTKSLNNTKEDNEEFKKVLNGWVKHTQSFSKRYNKEIKKFEKIRNLSDNLILFKARYDHITEAIELVEIIGEKYNNAFKLHKALINEGSNLYFNVTKLLSKVYYNDYCCETIDKLLGSADRMICEIEKSTLDKTGVYFPRTLSEPLENFLCNSIIYCKLTESLEIKKQDLKEKAIYSKCLPDACKINLLRECLENGKSKVKN